MRARLLDLGDVSAVRSQSVYHAVTAAMGPEDAPALILVRPASAGVSVGSFKGAMPDLDFCRARRLPVAWRHDGGETNVVDGNRLCFQLAMPRERAFELGLPRDLVGRFKRLAQTSIDAYRRLGIAAVLLPVNRLAVDGRTIGRIELTEIGQGICAAAAMVFEFDFELLAGVLRTTAAAIENSTTSIRRQLAEPPGLEAIAEAVVAASESCFGLELIPSLPTPEEMEGIYEWDEILQSKVGSRRQRLSA
jgi:lipoate-protein ligase A